MDQFELKCFAPNKLLDERRKRHLSKLPSKHHLPYESVIPEEIDKEAGKKNLKEQLMTIENLVEFDRNITIRDNEEDTDKFFS